MLIEAKHLYFSRGGDSSLRSERVILSGGVWGCCRPIKIRMEQDASKGMAGVRLRVVERSQVVAERLDDVLAPGHPARTIWEVSGALDLSAFYESIKAREGVVGRNSTDPRLLIALWLYATVRGVGAARELDRLCAESHPYQWLCGGVSVNYHLLSDFRVRHAEALDGLFTQVVAVLVKKGLVKVRRITQDGMRVRASAGASSFRRGTTLEKLQEQAGEHVRQLRQLLEDPKKSAGMSVRVKQAKQRAARERQKRIEEAKQLIPQLQERQRRSARRLSQKQQAEQQREPRASTTDAEVSRMKMSNGGFNPAINAQFAADPQSRAIVGVDVTSEGVDYEQSEPMRQQVEDRTDLKVEEHLYDGGYVKTEQIERAAEEGVTIYAPPKPPRNRDKRGDEFTPRAGDSEAIRQWRARMGSDQGKQIYKQRASTIETINAQMRRSGLTQLTVRGLPKARCVVLWAALAYNVMLLAQALVA
jgi:transposase